MKVYAVLGTAPLGRDRLSLKEIGQREVLISYADCIEPLLNLADLDQLIASKHQELNDHLRSARN